MIYAMLTLIGGLAVFIAMPPSSEYYSSGESVGWWFILMAIAVVALFIQETRFPTYFMILGILAVVTLGVLLWVYSDQGEDINPLAILTIIAIVVSMVLNYYRTDTIYTDSRLPTLVSASKGIISCEGEEPIEVFNYTEEIYGSSFYYDDANGNGFMRVPTIPCSYKEVRSASSK